MKSRKYWVALYLTIVVGGCVLMAWSFNLPLKFVAGAIGVVLAAVGMASLPGAPWESR